MEAPAVARRSAHAQPDPVSYLRFPNPDVAGGLTLAKILLQRAPKASSPAVRKAASLVAIAVVALEEKWTRQVATASRNLRPLARRAGAAWSAIRDRLLTYESFAEGNSDRSRAMKIHDLLFADGLEFLTLTLTRQHAESERRLKQIDERGLGKELEQLVGPRFVAALRATHQAFGDELGVSKPSLPVTPVFVVEQLRALTEAISDYALQWLALGRHDPEKREAVAIALSPIDEFRAAAARRVASDEDEEEEDDEGEASDSNVPAANAPVEPDPQATGTE